MINVLYLDLSAAFDTIDHQVFLLRLQRDYGVTGGVTDWMESYLTNRFQSISINSTLSEKIKLDYGFPQGSKIGPFGFKLYTKPLAAIAKKHGTHPVCTYDAFCDYCSEAEANGIEKYSLYDWTKQTIENQEKKELKEKLV